MKAGDKVVCVNPHDTVFSKVLHAGQVYTVEAVIGNLGLIRLKEVPLEWNSLRFIPYIAPEGSTPEGPMGVG